MKRYVKEVHKDLIERLTYLGSERSEEYLEARLKIDNALTNAERGLITNVEAVKSMLNAYDEVY